MYKLFNKKINYVDAIGKYYTFVKYSEYFRNTFVKK